MNKPAILLPIHPKYMAAILNGEKTIEVRKFNVPAGSLVYAYCTKSKTQYLIRQENYWDILKLGVNDRTEPAPETFACNGLVVASFVVSKSVKVSTSTDWLCRSLNEMIMHGEIADKACIEETKMYKYANGKDIYAWHISQLKIFDRPKELGEFYRHCDSKCNKCKNFDGKNFCPSDLLQITKAPQSYCYVEELKDEA